MLTFGNMFSQLVEQLKESLKITGFVRIPGMVAQGLENLTVPAAGERESWHVAFTQWNTIPE
jgi:hypothetical protein